MSLILNNIEYYIQLLKDKKPFSFTRWGDGEWGCAFGATGANCDSHIYFPEMKKGLNEAIIHPKVIC